MQRGAKLEEKEGVFIHWIGTDFDRGDRGRGTHGCAVALELQDFHAVTNRRGLVEARAVDALQKLGSGCGQKRKIGVVVDDLDLGGGFECGLRFFQFNVGVIVDQLGGDEDASVREDHAQTLAQHRRVFTPWLAEVVGLAGHIDPDHGRERSGLGLRSHGR